MNEDLLATLRGLRHDPTLAVRLYHHLHDGRYWAVVQRPGGDLAQLRFLTSPTADGLRELPVFTASDRSLLQKFCADIPAAMAQEIPGPALWRRALELVATGECVVAVDPDEPHAIRVTREMVQGMVSLFDDAE